MKPTHKTVSGEDLEIKYTKDGGEGVQEKYCSKVREGGTEGRSERKSRKNSMMSRFHQCSLLRWEGNGASFYCLVGRWMATNGLRFSDHASTRQTTEGSQNAGDCDSTRRGEIRGLGVPIPTLGIGCALLCNMHPKKPTYPLSRFLSM